MASVYRKGGKWWAKVKGDKKPGEWSCVVTPYPCRPKPDDWNRDEALRWAKKGQERIDARGDRPRSEVLTVTNYADQWLAEPARQALASFPEMRGHLKNHVLPRIGGMRMRDVRPRHIRDLVRELKMLIEAGELSPKTVLNIFGTTRTMFHDAIVDEVIEATPCVLARDDLPAKVDKDPEWRELATYERAEVLQLLTSPKIPPERRVQYALKALAGLRHGEVAGLRWRAWLQTEPLTRLSIGRTYQDQRTKTKVTRAVPVHPALARVLEAWQSLWETVYGRSPEADDFLVPTRHFTPVDPSDAGIAFKADLEGIGLRVDAGEHRDRGGHDLRAWFISTALEDGAAPDALYAVTHTKKKDVASGYNRQRWARLCAAVSSLQMELVGEPLELGTDELPRLEALRSAYNKRSFAARNVATPTGFEPVLNVARRSETQAAASQSGKLRTSCDVSLAGLGSSASYRPDGD